MSDLRDLYQEVVFDHYKKPRNFGCLSNANRKAEGDNPLCGDRITVYLHIEDGLVADVSFEGSGCAISTASASLMTEALKGRSESDAAKLIESFHASLTTPEKERAQLGKLEVLQGVREFPVRVKCATLAWHTANSALKNIKEKVTTE
ncbi:MAG: Fe-S cluster assembly sulfur transfer protein SufU [Burkholderiales bacterium]